jgi:hypothetical protein
LKTVADMTVLATTGWPVVLIKNVPLPLKLICAYSCAVNAPARPAN